MHICINGVVCTIILCIKETNHTLGVYIVFFIHFVLCLCSQRSILCILFLVGCVVGEFIKSLVVHDNMLINGTASVDWIPTGDSPGDKLRSAITCLTYLSLTLVCHFNILPLERELKNPTRKRIVLVNLLGMLTAFGIYVVIGVFGYLSVSMRNTCMFVCSIL